MFIVFYDDQGMIIVFLESDFFWCVGFLKI